MGKKAMGLGKGLGDVMRDHNVNIESITTERPNDATKIPLSLIDANPFQPRKYFNQEALEELASSIKLHGILEPVLLRKRNDRYQIVSGERRVRASKIAGLAEIEARVFDLLSDKTMAEWAIIENIQREDLDPIEAANSYQQLLDSYDYTHDDLATRLGKSRTAVTNSLRLLKLPESVKQYVAEGKLSVGAARSLLSPNITNPEKAAQEIIEKGMSVREAEQKAKKVETLEKPMDPEMRSFLNFLQNAFGTKVENKGSAIVIHYSSHEDLTRIQQAIKT